MIKMNNYLYVLQEIMMYPKKFQSDFCRYNAHCVAELASRQHISSVIKGEQMSKWYITDKGISLLKEMGWL